MGLRQTLVSVVVVAAAALVVVALVSRNGGSREARYCRSTTVGTTRSSDAFGELGQPDAITRKTVRTTAGKRSALILDYPHGVSLVFDNGTSRLLSRSC
jgi:hypothetical protein